MVPAARFDVGEGDAVEVTLVKDNMVEGEPFEADVGEVRVHVDHVLDRAVELHVAVLGVDDGRRLAVVVLTFQQFDVLGEP